MSITKINPKSLYDGAPHGLSHAVVDEVSGLVFISGQVDWTPDYQVKSDNIGEQTRNAISNLKKVLAEAGSDISHVLQLRVYVRGELADHMEMVIPIMVETFGTTRPAVTGVGVSSLASPDTLVEIEAVARVKKA